MDITLGELSITPERVFWRGREVALRPAERKLLQRLAAAPDRVHRRTELVSDGADERTVDARVSRIRRSLDGGGHAIVTVRRVGYRIDPDRLR